MYLCLFSRYWLWTRYTSISSFYIIAYKQFGLCKGEDKSNAVEEIEVWSMNKHAGIYFSEKVGLAIFLLASTSQYKCQFFGLANVLNSIHSQ
jgi:hypothetical protein